MDNIIIVTAFFDISRGKWNKFNRSREEYFDYFKFWASIKNELIVYVGNEEDAQKVLTIRDSFSLKDKTLIINTGDPFLIDPEIYNQLRISANSRFSRNFKLNKNNPESWNAEYLYLVHLKFYFLYISSKRFINNQNVAWIDFGFNHGGKLYINQEEFSFLWKYPFAESIHLFSNDNNPLRSPILKSIQLMKTYIMAGTMVAKSSNWQDFYEKIRFEQIGLLKIGILDDEQTTLLIMLNKYPEMFTVHLSDWFLAIKQFGGGHLTIKNKVTESSFILRVLRNIKYRLNLIFFLYNYYSILIDDKDNI